MQNYQCAECLSVMNQTVVRTPDGQRIFMLSHPSEWECGVSDCLYSGHQSELTPEVEEFDSKVVVGR